MVVKQTSAVKMDAQDKRQIGEQIEPGGRPRAPGRLEIVQRFVNTWNHDLPTEWDRLGTSARARAWLRDKGLLASRGAVTEEDAGRLRELREALRSLVVANTTGMCGAAPMRVLRRVAVDAPLVVVPDDDGLTRLRAHVGGVDGAIATLLVIVHEAQLTGDWTRLKGCRQCSYAFFDRSKNRSAAWCSMSICGNRSKNRAYHQRHQPAD